MVSEKKPKNKISKPQKCDDSNRKFFQWHSRKILLYLSWFCSFRKLRQKTVSETSIYIYIYIHTHIYIYTHIYIHTHIFFNAKGITGIFFNMGMQALPF